MTDQPAQTPDQQPPSDQQVQGNPPNTAGGAPAGYIEIARYNGLVRKVEELTLANRGLTDQLAQKTSESEQLKGQLAVKDTEKTVAVGERDKQLQTALQRVAELEASERRLKGLELKVKVAKDLNRPELLKIAERIPDLTDEEALKTVMTDFLGFADDMVKQREQQLLAGITPASGPGGSAVNNAPATPKAWEDHINSLPLGSKEREKALMDYGDFLERQHQVSA